MSKRKSDIEINMTPCSTESQTIIGMMMHWKRLIYEEKLEKEEKLKKQGKFISKRELLIEKKKKGFFGSWIINNSFNVDDIILNIPFSGDNC